MRLSPSSHTTISAVVNRISYRMSLTDAATWLTAESERHVGVDAIATAARLTVTDVAGK
jgi:hypothetical protein